MADAGERVWVTALAGASAAVREYARGRGCTQCNGTGYHGRIGVYELLEIDPQMADALRQNDQANYTRLASESLETLAHCALDYALQGITSLTEVFRVAEELTDTTEDADTAVPPAPETPAPLDSGPAVLDPDSVVL